MEYSTARSSDSAAPGRSTLTIEPLEDEQTAQLLSQANLYRMRKQWDEATTACMQVLYHSPDNWRAHAQLGDIYADQNRPEEAIQWYCMTLDIRPESQSVREKLSRIVNSQRREIVSNIDPTRPYIDRHGHSYRSGHWGKMLWYWSAPERRRAAAVSVSALALIALATSPIWFPRGARSADQPPVFTVGQVPTNTTLVLQPITPAAKDASAKATPSVTYPTAAVSQQPLSTPNTQPAQTIQQTPTDQAPVLRDSSDQSLTMALQSDTGLTSAGVGVTDAQFDPSSGSITVTYTIPDNGSPVDQSAILRSGVLVAKTALGKPQAADATQCTARCLIAQSDGISPGSATLTFVGTSTRAGLDASPQATAHTDQDPNAALFSTTWWAPSEAQPQAH